MIFPPRAVAAISSALVCCAAIFAAAPAFAEASSADLNEAVQAYRLCIAINLPPDFRKLNDPESAAQVASQKCVERRMELAGRYALDNPGTRNTRSYIDGVTIQLVSELGNWVDDVKARRVSPNPGLQRTR